MSQTPRADSAAGYGPGNEPPLLVRRPSAWFIVITGGGPAAVIVIFMLVVHLALAAAGAMPAAFWAFWIGVIVALLRLLWAVLEWMSRRYVLTGERLIAVAGILRRSAADVPLRHVRQLAVTQSVPERLLGLGTLTAATAGAGGFMLSWLMLRGPKDVLGIVRGVMEKAQREGAPERRRTRNPIPVIGLVGGVGSGKSEAARVLAERGFVLIDADALAKQALERADVKQKIVEWWGGAVLNPDGTPDRSAIAAIVFADPEQRRRLESLTHPIIKGSRRERVEKAVAEHRPGVVIDAPLLIEAGSDADCDLVVYVDAPELARLRRVKESRGWDGAELRRRENAQIPLEEKRRRADLVLVNDAGRDELERRVEQILPRLRTGV